MTFPVPDAPGAPEKKKESAVPPKASAPREHVFTARKGVTMFDRRVQFERAPEMDPGDGTKRYRFATADEDLAARLREVPHYGITEVAP